MGAVLLTSTGTVVAQEPQPKPIDVKGKTAFVLPVLNVTGEKWEELKSKITTRTFLQIRNELESIGASILADEPAQSIVKESSFDLNDEENWKRDVFYDLGQRAQADYVVFAVIMQASQRTRINFFSSVPEGDVTIKFWILDVNNHEALMSAKQVNAKARAKSNMFGEAKGSECQLEAAERAVTAAIIEAFRLPKRKS